MNAETKWTPGLWRETIFADGTVGVHAREGDAFVEVSVSRGRFARENARLIAAAPDLFEALANLRARVSFDARTDSQAMRAADAALSKAGG